MKPRGRLLLAFITAASASALVISLQPTDIERRHATIRPGMTLREVGKIMDAEMVSDKPISPRGSAWWSVPRRFGGASSVFLEVEFDEHGRVVRTDRATLESPEP